MTNTRNVHYSRFLCHILYKKSSPSGCLRRVPVLRVGSIGLDRGQETMTPGNSLEKASKSTRRTLAAVLRALNLEAVNPAAPADFLRNGAADLEALTKRMKEHPLRRRRVGFRKTESDLEGREFDYGMQDLSPLSGTSNPLAPPVRVDNRAERHAVGVVTFPATFASPSGSLHNGHLAAAIDEVFGATLARLGKPAMTGILDVRFDRACPIEKEVRIEGGVRRISGSTIFTEATVFAEGRSLAKADAVFFVVGEITLRELTVERNRRYGLEETRPGPDRGLAEGHAEMGNARTPRRLFAQALRSIASEVVARDAPEALFREAVVATEALVARMTGTSGSEPVPARSPSEEPGVQNTPLPLPDRVDCSPVTGMDNPIAPPLIVHRGSGSAVTANVIFSAAFEGAPGLAHGGIVAAAFDELLGLTRPRQGDVVTSSSLKVRYRSPCPLHTELSMNGTLKKVDGRQTSTRGTLQAGNRLVADAEATFVAKDPPPN